jgi:hypothetical protein
MNVRPLNYGWTTFYDHLVDLTSYSFSWRAIRRRLGATAGTIPRWMNVVRAMSSEGWGRIRYHTNLRHLLDTDPEVRGFLEGTTAELPGFYRARIERDLGRLYRHLPQGALMHDPNAYLNSEGNGGAVVTQLNGARNGRRAATSVQASAKADIAH